MSKLVLEIPEDVAQALRFPTGEIDRELRKELALALYQRGALSAGKARTLAQMTRWAFDELLGQRRIRRHYSEQDLEEDLQYVQGHQ